MRRMSPAPDVLRMFVRLTGALVLSVIAIVPAAAQVIVGPNVNMGGGPASFTPPSTIIGDPFLQRQNEPSIAVSSRNPCHLLAGANDYRTVELEEAAGEVGDAWLGVFKSFDCGATWTSTLLPGHPVDQSPEGLASPIKGLAAAADPTVRAGTSGMFYYSGIAFNRGDRGLGKVFVSRFVDNNNKDGGDAIQYLGATQIDSGTSGQFLDKPWIVADIPRGNATCTVNNQTIPAGPVYLVYTSFVGGNNNVHSKILFSKSTDCGATWSAPAKLSESVSKNQGTAIAVDPGTGDIYIAWREFALPGDSNSRNSIIVTRSTNGGQTFTKAAAVQPGNYQFVPFDQASSPLTFRTNAYPTIAVVPSEADGRAPGLPGRVYVAWAARGFVAPRLEDGQTQGDARIVISSAIGGSGWSYPKLTDTWVDNGWKGHQIMPALAFAGGKMALAYYDLRDDVANGFEDLVFEYGQSAFNSCVPSPLPAGLGLADVLMCVVNSANGFSRRHTLDMRVAMADTACSAGGTPCWTGSSVLGSQKVSRYPVGRARAYSESTATRRQLQYNRPNLPIFSKGKFPFIGDYIDIAGPSFVTMPSGAWAWNTGFTANRPAPVFHVSWTDNRNVGTPPANNWEQFTPPNSAQCLATQVGIRNQDVYTAQIRPGLVVSAPMNFKRITGLQRSFVVVAHNTTDDEHTYVLEAIAPAGVVASFDQFSGFGALNGQGQPTQPLTSVEVRIPRKSSASRTLFVALEAGSPANLADVLVPVEVEQVPDQTGDTGFDMVFLNPDFENPDFENPDFENKELHNPDFENLTYANPDFENPDFENFALNTSIRNPDFENPDFENPDFENPDFENPDFENPDFENPDFENPDFENPDFENPDFENPDFENPDFENGSFEVSDTTWPVRNNGNTTSAYKANVNLQDPPAGVKYQLTVRKVYTMPAAVCGPQLRTSQSVPLINIVQPNVEASPGDRNFNDPSRDNATFWLGPNERALVTLRAYCEQGEGDCSSTLIRSLERKIALGVVAQGANCYAGDDGLGDLVGGNSKCEIVAGPPKDIYDPIPPTVSGPAAAVQVNDTDNSGSEPASWSVEAMDNVEVAAVTCGALLPTGVSGNVYQFTGEFPVGSTSVSCTATDLRGNAAAAAAVVTINVKDVSAPAFGAEPFSLMPATPDGTNGWYTSPTVTATVNVSDVSDITVGCTDTAGGTTVSGLSIAISGDGVHQVNCTASDSDGNTAGASASVSIDATAPPAPTFDVPAPTGLLGWHRGPVAFTASAADTSGVTATCTDNGAALAGSGMSFVVAGDGTHSISCLVTNGAGLTSAVASVTINIDGTAPVIAPVANMTAEATSASGALVDYAVPSATDAVDASVAATCVAAPGSAFPIGSSVVTCTATDDAGNTSAASFTITVGDTTPPSLSVPANITGVEATSAAGAAVTFAASATDAVDTTPSITCSPVSGSTFAIGTTMVTCSATDDAGNTSLLKSFSVTVVDTTAPVFGAAVNVTVEATSAAGATATYVAPTATDLLGASVSCAPASGSLFPLGSTVVTCTATDPAGNSSLRTLTVTVRDTTPPVVGAVSNISVEATSAAGAAVSYATPSATDAVGATVSCAPASGSTFAVGMTTVTCTAVDAAGNSASTSFTVTVADSQAPVVTAAANPPTLLWSPNKTMTPVTVSGVVTDASTVSVSYKVVDEYKKVQPTGTVTPGAGGSYAFVVSLEAYRNGNDSNGRLYTITVTAVDAGGRTKSVSTTVLVPHNQ